MHSAWDAQSKPSISRQKAPARRGPHATWISTVWASSGAGRRALVLHGSEATYTPPGGQWSKAELETVRPPARLPPHGPWPALLPCRLPAAFASSLARKSRHRAANRVLGPFSDAPTDLAALIGAAGLLRNRAEERARRRERCLCSVRLPRSRPKRVESASSLYPFRVQIFIRPPALLLRRSDRDSQLRAVVR